MSTEKKSVKDILNYALFKDYANSAPNSKSIFLNVPKYCDTLETLESIQSVMNARKEEILYISITENSHRTAMLNGYKTVPLYNILTIDEHGKLILKYGMPNDVLYIIIQSIDNMTSELIHAFEEIVSPMVRIFMLYDSEIIKKFIGLDIATLMWRFTNYEVIKIGRDKAVTSVAMYNMKNRMRVKTYDLQKIVLETNVQPWVLYHKENEASFDITRYLNVNIPIITSHKSYVLKLNREIRRYIGIENEDMPWRPQVNDYLALIAPGVAIKMSDNSEITLPVGYRFKITDIIHSQENGIMHLTFDYYDYSTKETYPCAMSINLYLLEELYHDENELDREERTLKRKRINSVYYGYVLGHWTTLEHSYDKAVVVYNMRLSYSKNDFYTCIAPIQSSVEVILIQ